MKKVFTRSRKENVTSLRRLYLSLSFYAKKISQTLGMISGSILLSAVYFIVLLPLSLIMRLSKKRSAGRSAEDISFYKTRDHLFVPADLENVW